MDQVKIGKFIRELRLGMGMKQRDIADQLGVTDKTVSKWECGNGLPEVALMLPLCTILGISVCVRPSFCLLRFLVFRSVLLDRDYSSKPRKIKYLHHSFIGIGY